MYIVCLIFFATSSPMKAASNAGTKTKLIGKNSTEFIFDLDVRYDLSSAKILGAGSFGVVCSAFDRLTNEDVAIKKLAVYCGDELDAWHELRELRMLKLFSVHPNVSSFSSKRNYFWRFVN